MTESTPESAYDAPLGKAPAVDQETQRLDELDKPDLDATRPMSLAELRELNLG
ncbi:hypothetical protein ABT297_35645 [Dactylosporangium sp. NPDC000555]|uniref:hypothetical protein n=1 Tax=Dactylosporangium sp. NPDC000555 TaxID=3154260 RepID=UPI00332BDC4E